MATTKTVKAANGEIDSYIFLSDQIKKLHQENNKIHEELDNVKTLLRMLFKAAAGYVSPQEVASYLEDFEEGEDDA